MADRNLANESYVHGWDGVRALAVVAVVVFHLEPTFLPGGFLGVTTFFVLAGALATTRIHREIQQTGTFRLGAYAGGRIRRLLPALLVYVGVVVVWVWFRRPVLFDEVASDAIAALLYVTPWRELSAPGGYAAAFSIGPEPLLHTWSLGVEEAAWILTGLSIALTRRVWSATVATAVLGVAGYLLWFGEADLYYSPARLAEFAIGAGLGLFLLARPRNVSWIVGAVGGAVLAAMMVNTHVVDVYDGELLIAATASAALVAAATTGAFATALSMSVLRWVGTRSYSIYLWHVGLIELTELPGWAIVATTGMLAEASYRWIESPVRARRTPRQLAPALLALTTIASIALLASPTPKPDFELDVADLGPASETDFDDIESFRINDDPAAPSCSGCRPSPIARADEWSPADVFTDADDPVSIAVIGDSTGVFLAIALEDWAERTGEATVHNLTVGGCSPLALKENGWTRTRISLDPGAETELPNCMPTIADIPEDSDIPEDIDIPKDIDLVVLIVTGMPLLDHRNPEGEWVDLTDPTMQAELSKFLVRSNEAATERNLPLVVATSAAMPDSIIPLLRDPLRAAAFNSVLNDTGLPTYDLTTPLESGAYLRFDGTHLHVDTELPYDGVGRNEGHRYVGEEMGPALVAYARSLTR